MEAVDLFGEGGDGGVEGVELGLPGGGGFEVEVVSDRLFEHVATRLVMGARIVVEGAQPGFRNVAGEGKLLGHGGQGEAQ